jgi:3-dehydroquinate synthase
MIVLVGFMGAGKSTVGRILARLAGLPFIDTDALVEAREGRTIEQIFSQDGERGFREVEREVVMETLAGDDAVIALGGGSLVDPQICRQIESATVVHLRVSYGEAMRRLGSETLDRPMLTLRDPRTLAAEREGVYEIVSDLGVETDGRSPRDVAMDIAVACFGPGIAADRPRHIPVLLPRGHYEVVVGRDLIENLPDHLPHLEGIEQIVVMTQPSLERLSTELIASLQGLGHVSVETLDEGEGAKSLASAEALYEALAARDFHRNDLIVSFGGGVVSDVAGFVASTYARGTRLVHIPTTLLAQVDAAIGGKTGVNLPKAKNMVGTFYQPDGVICDVDLLVSCPVEEVVSGAAEVVKYGLIADPSLLDLVESQAQKLIGGDAPTLIDVVCRSVEIKSEVVARDERDANQRAVLNYGHTLGHAIEQTMGYGAIRHGEAVAIGMMGAAYVGRALGLTNELVVDRHRRVLMDLGLPVSTDLTLEDLKPALQLDKKYRGGSRFVLLRAIGDPVLGVEVPEDVLEAAIVRLNG